MNMNFLDIRNIFNRALVHSFTKKKLLFVFLMLLLPGLFAAFCRGLSLHVSNWIVMSFIFFAIFLSVGILLSCGIVLIRMYHDEVKNRASSFRTVLAHSWKLIIGSLYLTLPFIFIFLFLWVIFGVFIFLKEIPSFGLIIEALFAFVPFVLILGILALSISAVALLFFITPVIALNEKKSHKIIPLVSARISQDPWSCVILFIIALFPSLIVGAFLIFSFILTDVKVLTSINTLQVVVQWFVMMIPLLVCSSPFIVFFFNFSAEAYVIWKKNKH